MGGQSDPSTQRRLSPDAWAKMATEIYRTSGTRHLKTNNHSFGTSGITFFCFLWNKWGFSFLTSGHIWILNCQLTWMCLRSLEKTRKMIPEKILLVRPKTIKHHPKSKLKETKPKTKNQKPKETKKSKKNTPKKPNLCFCLFPPSLTGLHFASSHLSPAVSPTLLGSQVPSWLCERRSHGAP